MLRNTPFYAVSFLSLYCYSFGEKDKGGWLYFEGVHSAQEYTAIGKAELMSSNVCVCPERSLPDPGVVFYFTQIPDIERSFRTLKQNGFEMNRIKMYTGKDAVYVCEIDANYVRNMTVGVLKDINLIAKELKSVSQRFVFMHTVPVRAHYKTEPLYVIVDRENANGKNAVYQLEMIGSKYVVNRISGSDSLSLTVTYSGNHDGLILSLSEVGSLVSVKEVAISKLLVDNVVIIKGTGKMSYFTRGKEKIVFQKKEDRIGLVLKGKEPDVVLQKILKDESLTIESTFMNGKICIITYPAHMDTKTIQTTRKNMSLCKDVELVGDILIQKGNSLVLATQDLIVKWKPATSEAVKQTFIKQNGLIEIREIPYIQNGVQYRIETYDAYASTDVCLKLLEADIVEYAESVIYSTTEND